MKDPEGLAAGAGETWGKYYSLQEKHVPYSSIANPSVIELPGAPPIVSHKVFEVRKGTPDDANEIQMKIDRQLPWPPDQDRLFTSLKEYII